MSMMMRRGMMGTGEFIADLYPVGTDIITEYIGRDGSGKGNFALNYWINNSGEYVYMEDNISASDVFIPVMPNYVFHKNDWRLYKLAYYDADKNFLGYEAQNNFYDMDLSPLPANTRYVRICTGNSNNWALQITRVS